MSYGLTVSNTILNKTIIIKVELIRYYDANFNLLKNYTNIHFGYVQKL